MPAVCLVVALHRDRDLLQRLLEKSKGCYDELIVVHDGPDEENVRAIVVAAGGRFLEGPRVYQPEPLWPLAWREATSDWIMKYDADEFPSDEMKQWLQHFRSGPEPLSNVSGYTCIWPLWDGKKAITRNYYRGRLFLYDRRKIRFFGMVEQGPVPDTTFEPVEVILCHQPKRKSFGFRNLLTRPRARKWQQVIAKSLMGKPTDFICWRWTDENWPPDWQAIRDRPFRTALSRFVRGPLRSLRSQWRLEKRFFIGEALASPLHHVMICLEYWKLSRKRRNGVPPSS